ncbi:MAG: SnoaL-like domain-containing protein [Chloroflexi bacterium]|jgi:uncharacterized protein|nr:SnoaL-like domain-containing protein [Chloroflexota bacterium]
MDATERRNLQVVQEFISLIGVGKLPAALETLDEDVYWESPVSQNPPPEISWAKARHGRQGVVDFIQDMWGVVQPYVMDTHALVAQGDRVMVEGKNQCVVRATGKKYDHDWVLVFRVKNGKIVSHKQYYDTAAILHAFR